MIIIKVINYKYLSIVLFGIFWNFFCSNEHETIQKFEKKIIEIEKQYIPDKSIGVFNVTISKDKGKWIIEGETDNKYAHTQFVKFADSLLPSKLITNNFLILPDTALGDSNFAIIKVSVTPLRENPRHSSQMVDQAILGNEIKLLRYQKGWYLSKTHYDYVGWINKSALFVCDSIEKNNWTNNAKYIVSDLQTTIYSSPSDLSQAVTDAVLNNILIGKNQTKDYISVVLPDRRTGFIYKNSLKPMTIHKQRNGKSKDILVNAYKMFGVPYLWGGNSTKGNDCSGFTQTVFKSNGIQIPRDARQQALEGIEIIPDENWSNISPGDLLFFGSNNRVTHVGISTGKKDFIHQGGMVSINSLDENSINFSPERLKTFLFIKRLNEL